MSSLDQKIVMITGAGKGLGRATALAVSRAGARLSLASRSAPDLESIRRESGAEPLCRAGDVADERFIDRWVEETLVAWRFISAGLARRKKK